MANDSENERCFFPEKTNNVFTVKTGSRRCFLFEWHRYDARHAAHLEIVHLVERRARKEDVVIEVRVDEHFPVIVPAHAVARLLVESNGVPLRLEQPCLAERLERPESSSGPERTLEQKHRLGKLEDGKDVVRELDLLRQRHPACLVGDLHVGRSLIFE